jgi:hypothetical protein
MMKMRRCFYLLVRSVLVLVVLLIGLLALLVGFNVWAMRDLPLLIFVGSNSQIELRARKDAVSDIAAGKPHLCLTGGFGPHPVGLSESEQYALDNLPGTVLPWSCEISEGSFIDRVGHYAVAYNQEVSRHFQSSHVSSNQSLQPTAGRSDV